MSGYRILQSTAAVRKDPTHQSELTNQLLFGESYEIIANTGVWAQVRSTHDKYVGWIDQNCLSEYTEKKDETYLITKSVALVNYREDIYQLPFGSLCPVYMLKHNSNKNDFARHSMEKKEAILTIKKQFQNAPYLWGGRTLMGIDCSGLTQLFARCLGCNIKRDAWQQAEEGKTVEVNDELLPGDLIFFKTESEKITHVGIFIGEDKILHSSGRVRVDLLTKEGIIHVQTGKLTHRLVCCTRIA